MLNKECHGGCVAAGDWCARVEAMSGLTPKEVLQVSRGVEDG